MDNMYSFDFMARQFQIRKSIAEALVTVTIRSKRFTSTGVTNQIITAPHLSNHDNTCTGEARLIPEHIVDRTELCLLRAHALIPYGLNLWVLAGVHKRESVRLPRTGDHGICSTAGLCGR
jgi:hypothetical protein